MNLKYILAFDIVPGKWDEFWEFCNSRSVPFWNKFEETVSFTVYTAIGSSPIYEMHLEIKDFEAYARISSDPEFRKIGSEILQFIQNPVRKFLVPQEEYK